MDGQHIATADLLPTAALVLADVLVLIQDFYGSYGAVRESLNIYIYPR